MPIDFPFFLFAKPTQSVLRWIRLDTRPTAPDSSLAEAQRRIAQSLPPHLRRDVLRDE